MFYKLTDRENRSVWIGRTKPLGGAITQYKEKEFVSANPILAAMGFNLFVFDDLLYAFKFISKLPYGIDIRIWECECEDEVDLPYQTLSTIELEEIIYHPDDPTWWLETRQHLFCLGSRSFRRVKLTKFLLELFDTSDFTILKNAMLRLGLDYHKVLG